MKKQINMLWHGGSSYSCPTQNDAETFPSIAAAKRYFDSRPGDPYYPCVSRIPQDDGGPSAWLFVGEVGDYPDFILSYGPKGGLRCERA